jgi:hypothetical protein
MHLLAGPEERDAPLPHRDLRAGARIAPRAGRAVLDRKRPEPAQFDPISPCQRGGNRVQDAIDDVFDVTLVEMRILRGHALDQFGFDQLPRSRARLEDDDPPETCCRRAEGRRPVSPHASSVQSLPLAECTTLIWIRAEVRRPLNAKAVPIWQCA